MRADQWVLELLLGGLLGLLGQGIRVVTGLKKVNDQAAAEGKTFGALFEPSQLVISLLIGFIAGAVAVVSMNPADTGNTIGRQTIVTLLAAGYAGADFVEGFMKKYLPGGTSVDGAKEPALPAGPDQPAMG